MAILLACGAAGALGGAVTLPEIPGWYAQLAKPSWTPPNQLFGPVWTMLYVAMGFAAWLIWRVPPQAPDVRRLRRAALTVFWIQLAANAVWSPLFFGLHAVGAAFLDILLLLLGIAAMTALFWKLARAAALLTIPYLGWTAYAACLNGAIWAMSGS